MGYVLPFGQMSFWGATVITNLLSPFPSLVEWICGGYCVHSPTLKRFFCFHFQPPFLLFSRMDLWRILCSQSNIEEVLLFSFSTPISSLWFYSSSSFLSSFSIF